jgi:hypothetical protein
VGTGVGTAWMAPPQRFSPAPGRVTQPELAEGQSAGCFDSLQLPLLFLKAGPAGGPSRHGRAGRWRGYASALVVPLGHVRVIVDHFHVIRLANTVVDQRGCLVPPWTASTAGLMASRSPIFPADSHRTGLGGRDPQMACHQRLLESWRRASLDNADREEEAQEIDVS